MFQPEEQIKRDIEEARRTGIHIPGVTYRRCSDVVRRYFKAGPKNKVLQISRTEYEVLDAAAVANPYDLSRPRAWTSTCHFNRDWFTRADVWIQDNNSPADIEHYLRTARPKALWKTNYVFGLNATTAANKLQSLLYESVESKGNPATLNKLLSHLDTAIFPQVAHYTSKLVCNEDEHKPNLPVHRWTKAQCDEILSTFGRLGTSYPATMDWRGSRVVPYRVYQNFYLEFIEVIPKKQYDEQFGPAQMPLTETMIYQIGNETMCDTYRSFLVHGADDCDWNRVLLTMCSAETELKSQPQSHKSEVLDSLTNNHSQSSSCPSMETAAKLDTISMQVPQQVTKRKCNKLLEKVTMTKNAKSCKSKSMTVETIDVNQHRHEPQKTEKMKKEKKQKPLKAMLTLQRADNSDSPSPISSQRRSIGNAPDIVKHEPEPHSDITMTVTKQRKHLKNTQVASVKQTKRNRHSISFVHDQDQMHPATENVEHIHCPDSNVETTLPVTPLPRTFGVARRRVNLF